jgi:hypothetical protein
MDKTLSIALDGLKSINTLPEDVTIALHSFIKVCEGMVEFNMQHIPTEYCVNLIETMGKYPKYRVLANHLATVILDDLGYLDK